MQNEQRHVFHIIQPHPIKGTVLALLGLALLTCLWWLPPEWVERFDSTEIRYGVFGLGGVLFGVGLWRLSWRHRLIIDQGRRRVSWGYGFFGWGKSGSVGFDELFGVRIRHEFGRHVTNDGRERITERYPISLEGPSISVDAGWSGYHGESFLRAESLAQKIGVEVQDLS